MKKVLLFLFVFLLCPLNVSAASKLSVLKNGDFSKLSRQDQEDTITALVDKISKDLALQSTPRLYFYSADDWPVAAEYYDCINYIYVNLSTFKDTTDADAAGETVGYHLVRIIAHECRHDYQFEHMNDDTDYGKAVKANKDNYQLYYEGMDAYRNQFIEADAEEYAVSYADSYFKR